MVLRLRTKILLVFVGLVLVSSVISVGISVFSIKETLTKDLIQRIVINTKARISDITDFVLIGDKEGIINSIYNQKSSQKDLSYLFVLDSNGKMIASTFVNQDPDFFITSNALPKGLDQRVQLIQQKNGQDVYDIALRLDYDQGVLRVGVFKNQIDSSIVSIVYLLILGVVVSIVIAITASFFFTRNLFRPLDTLKNAVDKISAGDLSSKITVRTKDEIWQLANAFNAMMSKLAKSYEVLEQRVQERTAALAGQVAETEKSKTAILNLLEDIAEEKKKVEQTVIERTRELATEKARLLASIESLTFGFVIADLNDRVIMKNPALSTILELTEDPTSIRDIVNSLKGVSSDLDVLVHSCRECIDLKKVVELKELSHGKKYLRVFCTPILTKDEDGDGKEEAIGYVMLVEDITEAKVMERSRDEFFAVASHELRTPLTAIRGNADMILEMYADKIIDKDMKEMLQDIDSSSIRLIAVVNDFLDASRLEQGKAELKKEVFAVTEVVEKAVRDMKTMAEQKGLSLVHTPPDVSPPQVYADKSKTEQILINLIGNAIKFTKQGGITISVTTAEGFVGVHVTDTGEGISEHNQALLFRKFQQAGEDMLARDVTQSTGLGLYISKLIILSMGGTIGLEKSELGKGSIFGFTLPISK